MTYALIIAAAVAVTLLAVNKQARKALVVMLAAGAVFGFAIGNASAPVPAGDPAAPPASAAP